MNPFDELEVDPRMSARELTEELRHRAELAKPENRERIQTLWRTLTLNETDRLKWALLAHPRPAGAKAGEVEALKHAVPPILVRYPDVDLVAKGSDLFLAPHFEHDVPTPPPLGKKR